MELTGEARVVALCDRDPARLEALGPRYPQARVTRELDELLADPDVEAVAVATPVVTHFAVAKACLEAGKHVLVEKPITRTAAEAFALIDVARAAGRVLMVGHVFEYNATLLALRDLIRRGHLGPVHYLFLERTNLGPVRVDVNALYDLASHDISIVNLLLEEPPATVSARGASFLNPGTEDVVFATFGFPGGQVAHVHASWLNPIKVRRITVVGAEKMAQWDDLDLRTPIQIYDKRVEMSGQKSASFVPDTFIAHKTAVFDGGMTAPRVQANEPLKDECRHFLACVRGEATPISGGESGARVMCVLEAATRSMREESRLVEVDYGPLAGRGASSRGTA